MLDTLMAHRENCVGMAANMIGVRKHIIAFLDESERAFTYTVMLNPEIIKKDGTYDTEKGCLSILGGPRKCKRYDTSSFSIGPRKCKRAQKTSPTGLHRSFSMRYIIETES